MPMLIAILHAAAFAAPALPVLNDAIQVERVETDAYNLTVTYDVPSDLDATALILDQQADGDAYLYRPNAPRSRVLPVASRSTWPRPSGLAVATLLN